MRRFEMYPACGTKTAVIVVFAAIAAGVTLPATARDRGVTSRIDQTLQLSRDALGAAALTRGGMLVTERTLSVNGLSGIGNSVAEIGGARFAEQTSTPPIAMGDGYDGSSFWNEDQSGLVWTDGSASGLSQEIDTAYAADYTLFGRGMGGATVAWEGVKADGGRRYVVVAVTPRHSLVPMQVWIDATTHLPARYVIAAGPITYETCVSDYRSADGLMVPRHIESKSSDGNSSRASIRAARTTAVDNAALEKPTSHANDFSIAGGRPSTSLPVDLIDNHVYVDVTLDGKGPYRFVFDTGGSNLIDPAVAKALNVVGSGSARDTGTGAQPQAFSYAILDSVKIGNAVLRHQIFSVEPISKGFGVATGQRVDGLIGFEVLARYVTTFDNARRILTLAMPGVARSSGADVLHFVFAGTVPQIDCAIDGIPSACTVDTGATGSLSLYAPFVADHPQIVPAAHSAVGVNGYGVGGGHRGFMGRLRSIGIGDFTLHDLVAGFSTQNQGALAAPFFGANVGGGVWKRFTVTFDYGAETMTLQPNASLGERDTHDRSGLFPIDKAGKIVVYDVRAGTPAAQAGLTKGDVILSIDGVAPRSLEQVRQAMRQAPGTVLHVQITDTNGAQRTVLLTLREWV